MRLVLGLLLVKLFTDLVRFEVLMDRESDLTSWQLPTDYMFWILAAFFFWILPLVVNLGFGKSWGRRPQIVLATIVAIVGAWGLVVHGSVWTPALGWVVLVWLLYVSLHLGTSFLVATALATPGCEMRAWPDLWSRLTGRPTAEHYCPGFLDPLDRWEQSRANPPASGG